MRSRKGSQYVESFLVRKEGNRIGFLQARPFAMSIRARPNVRKSEIVRTNSVSDPNVLKKDGANDLGSAKPRPEGPSGPEAKPRTAGRTESLSVGGAAQRGPASALIRSASPGVGSTVYRYGGSKAMPV